jgi:hypothetical protein
MFYYIFSLLYVGISFIYARILKENIETERNITNQSLLSLSLRLKKIEDKFK